jgi:hypothetical protein
LSRSTVINVGHNCFPLLFQINKIFYIVLIFTTFINIRMEI